MTSLHMRHEGSAPCATIPAEITMSDAESSTSSSSNSGGAPLLRPEDAALSADTLSAMMEQERTAYHCAGYLNPGGDHGNNAGIITPADRMRLVDWCYQLVDQCQFQRESVAVAMDIADRFMSRVASAAARSPGYDGPTILHDHALYQLLAVTALYVSVKINEKVVTAIEDMAALSQGMYSVEDIEDMELTLLRGLSWRLNPPTSFQVADHVLLLLRYRVQGGGAPSHSAPCDHRQGAAWAQIRDDVAFQTEIAVREYSFVGRRPSTVAVAAIINAVEQSDDCDFHLLMTNLMGILRSFDFDSPADLLEARDLLRQAVEENDDRSSSPSHEANGELDVFDQEARSDFNRPREATDDTERSSARSRTEPGDRLCPPGGEKPSAESSSSSVACNDSCDDVRRLCQN